jgi:hypothetical protein
MPRQDELAIALRTLARQVERGEVRYLSRHTINPLLVEFLCTVHDDGAMIFDDRNGYDADVRVLFVCFAACLAETGDL